MSFKLTNCVFCRLVLVSFVLIFFVHLDKVVNIDQGVFIAEKEVMCYIACIYKSVQVVKKDRLDGDAISKQIDLLYPQDMKESVKNGVVKCMPVQSNYKDSCEGIFYATKCLYESDPSNFVFA